MTLVARLQEYIDEQSMDWDLFVQSITFGYN